MLPINSETKVGKFWDWPIDRVNDQTFEEVKVIIEFRERALNKVKIGEWTKEEYKHFSGTICSFEVKKFIEFIDVLVFMLEMPRESSQKEIDYLQAEHFFLPNVKNKSKIRDFAELVSWILSKLYSISGVDLTEEEKNIRINATIEEHIEANSQLLAQIQDYNSDYIKIFKEFYKKWVDETFNDQSLKDILHQQEDKIIKLKEQSTRNNLRKYISLKNKIAFNRSDLYFRDHAKMAVCKKIMKKK